MAIDLQNLPPERLKVMTRVVFAVQFFTNILYFGLGMFLISRFAAGGIGPGVQGGPDPMLLRAVLGGAALTLLAVTVLMRRIQMSPDRWRKHFAAGENGPWLALHRLTITTGTLLDGLGMLGLILGIFTRQIMDLAPFVGVAACAMLVVWPRESLVETMRLRVQSADAAAAVDRARREEPPPAAPDR